MIAMDNINYDVIIPIAENDIPALKRNLPYLYELFSEHEIVVIANENAIDQLRAETRLKLVDENKMLPGLKFSRVKELIEKKHSKAGRRTGWYFQQFLKLGYSRICEKDFYMSWDSDTYILNKLDFFDENGKPYLDTLPQKKEDQSFYDTIEVLWGQDIASQNEKSFITAHMMFIVDIMNNMLQTIEDDSSLSGKTFFEKIISAVPVEILNLSGFSEFNTYALYTINNYPNLYKLREWNNLRHGAVFFGRNPSKKQMEWASKSFDVISIEDFDTQLFICKYLCSENRVDKVPFIQVYSKIEPIIKFKYQIRMTIRNIVKK